MICSFTLADDLANLSLTYCNTQENTLQYQIQPAEKTWLCYTLSNGAKTSLTVKISFVDGTFTNDQRQNKACLSDADTINFGQYVTGYDSLVTLKPGESVKKEATVYYPQNMDGLYHGCIIYSIVEKPKDTKSTNTNFSILMRRAKFIDVIVGNPENAKERGIALEKFTDAEWSNLSHNKNIRIYKDTSDNTYMIQLKIKNISPVEQDVVITWVASNILVYKNTFVESRKILKWETLLITKKLESIPSYNLKVKFDIANIPFTFGGQAPVIWQIYEKTTFWIWNVVTYITLIGILLFVGIVILLIQDITKKRGQRATTVHQPKKWTTAKK